MGINTKKLLSIIFTICVTFMGLTCMMAVGACVLYLEKGTFWFGKEEQVGWMAVWLLIGGVFALCLLFIGVVIKEVIYPPIHKWLWKD